MKKNVLVIALVLLVALVSCAEHECSWDDGKVTLPPTCTVDGEKTLTCEGCGATRTEKIEALGHDYVWETTTEATCVEDGVATEKCSRCPATGETKAIPAAHEYDANGECIVCHAKKDEVEKAEARIGIKYYAEISEAISDSSTDLDKPTYIVVLSKNVLLPTQIVGKSIVFEGSGKDNTILHLPESSNGTGETSAIISAKESFISFRNLTVDFKYNEKVSNYAGLIDAYSLIFAECVIDGMGTYWGVGDVVFKNCEFKDNNDYSLWLYSGKNFVFEDCSFTSSVGKFLHPYSEGSISLTVTIKNCSFENTSETKESGKPVVNIKKQAVCNVSFEGDIKLVNVATGMQESKFFQVESDNGSVVLIDGEQVYPKN